MAAEYHHTGSGTSYTLNSDGTVTRQGGPSTSPRASSSDNNGSNHNGLWILLFIVAVIIAIVIGINVYNENSYLHVSPSSINVDADGGTVYVDVSSNRDWKIKTGLASWGHASKYSKYRLSIRIDENTNTSSRSDWMELSCTNRSVHINVSQEAKKYFTISSNSVDVGEDGGTYTFTISTNESWSITTNTYSWGHLTKGGNSLSLRVDANPNTSSRSDFFIITSQSGKELKVTISQEGRSSYDELSDVSALINSVWVDHNVYENGLKGMQIHVDFDINGMFNRTGRVIVYFYYDNDSAIKDLNNRYCTTNGYVSCGENYTPRYSESNYSDFKLFIPHSELHLNSKSSCYFVVTIWANNEQIYTGSKQYFTFTP